MIFGKCETASLFNYSRLTLLLIIFHLISSDQTANANNNPETNLARKDQLVEPIQISFTTVSTNCHNSSDGSIDIYITGGVEPYSFLWSDGSIAEDLLLVKAGVYTVIVTDANRISQTGTASIEAPEEFELETEIVNCSEKSLTGLIDIHLSGGTAPYTYAWSNGENKSVLSNLSPGVYSLTYTDINGCSGSLSTEIYFLSDVNSISKNEEFSITQKGN